MTVKMRILSLFVLGTAFFLAVPAQAAIVVFGSATGYQSTSKDWLSNTSDDIDGNGLGTDGYIFFGDFPVTQPNNNTNPGNDQNENIFGANVMASSLLTAARPSYISIAATGADSGNIGRYNGYESIDSPILGDGTDRVAGNLLVSGAGRALDFTVSNLAANTTVRVGVLGAVLNDDGRARFDAPEIGLTDGTSTISVTGLPNLSDGTAGASLGWVFFDIDSDGDYTILVPPDAAGPSPAVTGLGGVTFDSVTAVPEPSSLAILGLGAVGLVARRRRRRAC